LGINGRELLFDAARRWQKTPALFAMGEAS
jgi:hypothetical protein